MSGAEPWPCEDPGFHAFLRSQQLLAHGRPDRALEFIRTAILADPSNPYLRASLAGCLCSLARFTEAEVEARRALELGPDLDLAHFALARAVAGLGRLEEADRALGEALRIDPDFAAAYLSRAIILRVQGRLSEALEAVQEALRREPGSVEARNVLGEILIASRRDADAAHALREALALDPEDAASHLLRGWLFLFDRSTDRAAESFREALRLSPGLEAAREGLVEALKARNSLYRRSLPFFNAVRRMGRPRRALFTLGAFLAPIGCLFLASSHPPIAWVVAILGLGALVLVYFNWVAGLITLAIVARDREVRAYLSREELRSAGGATICLALTAAGLIGWLLNWSLGSPSPVVGLFVAAAGALSLLPLAALSRVDSPSSRGIVWATGFLAFGLMAASVWASSLDPKMALVPLFMATVLSFMTVWAGSVLGKWSGP